MVLERQLGKARPRFSADRAFLAVLLHRLPRDALGRFRLLVRPETVLRWHRDQLARRHAARSRAWHPGRLRTVRSVRLLVLRLARKNPCWGCRRIHGELLVLGIKVAASTGWEILQQAGVDPAPERTTATWVSFLRSQADALLACDFFETVTLTGAACTCLRLSSTPAAGSGCWAQLPIPPRPGSPRPRGTWSWISRTPGAGRGS
jgi:putative transposase